jgi:hypothetical protein
MVFINQPFAFPVSDISQLDMDVETLAMSWHPSINHLPGLCPTLTSLTWMMKGKQYLGIHQSITCLK